MGKTERELAFVRDLLINDAWTKRFTGLLDKHVGLKDAKSILYINAGTGDHCIEIREKVDEKTSVFATCENSELLQIAKDKAAAVRADIGFSTTDLEEGSFDAVIVDATFTRPAQIDGLVRDAARALRPGGQVAVVLPTAGSFGEIVSLLWEVLFNEDLGEHGSVAEAIIAEIPTVSRVEEIAAEAGLTNLKTESAKEVFEYDNGADFVASPLVSDFLVPTWLESLDDKEKERVTEGLAQLIDDEDGTLSFRFTVKATVVMGEKS